MIENLSKFIILLFYLLILEISPSSKSFIELSSHNRISNWQLIHISFQICNGLCGDAIICSIFNRTWLVNICKLFCRTFFVSNIRVDLFFWVVYIWGSNCGPLCARIACIVFLKYFFLLRRRYSLLLNFANSFTIDSIGQKGLVITLLILFVRSEWASGSMLSSRLSFLWIWGNGDSTNVCSSHLGGHKWYLRAKGSPEKSWLFVLQLCF